MIVVARSWSWRIMTSLLWQVSFQKATFSWNTSDLVMIMMSWHYAPDIDASNVFMFTGQSWVFFWSTVPYCGSVIDNIIYKIATANNTCRVSFRRVGGGNSPLKSILPPEIFDKKRAFNFLTGKMACYSGKISSNFRISSMENFTFYPSPPEQIPAASETFFKPV